MNEIAELEGRISQALDRIGRRLDTISGGITAPGAPGSAEEKLQKALQSEQDTNAQLTERVRAIKDKQEKTVNTLEAKVARLMKDLDTASQELQRQKRVVTDLEDTTRALREAVEAGVSDPALVNQAMTAELEALRSARAVEIAELDAIMAELKPIVDAGETADA